MPPFEITTHPVCLSPGIGLLTDSIIAFHVSFSFFATAPISSPSVKIPFVVWRTLMKRLVVLQSSFTTLPVETRIGQPMTLAMSALSAGPFTVSNALALPACCRHDIRRRAASLKPGSSIDVAENRRRRDTGNAGINEQSG
jgi:hypothetical protein